MTNVITTIFAPTEETANVAEQTMACTSEHFPDARRIAAVDLATPRLMDVLSEAGWHIVQLRNGRPPRMTRLLREATALCADSMVWTIEMDSYIKPGAREIAEGLLDVDDALAGVECAADNARGRATPPTQGREIGCKPWSNDMPAMLECTGVSFNCTCWRRVALAQANWDELPRLSGADTALGNQLSARGWRFGLSTAARCIHLRSTSCKAWRAWRNRNAQ